MNRLGDRRRIHAVVLTLAFLLQTLATSPPASATTSTVSPPQATADSITPPKVRDSLPFSAPGDTFQTGDVLIATGAQIQWRAPNWSLKGTIYTGGAVSDMAFDALGSLYVTTSYGNVEKYNAAGVFLRTFASGLNQPSAIDVDNAGNVVVGEKVYTVAPRVLVFDPSGNPVATWYPGQTSYYGDLASDGCTFRYTPNPSNYIGDAVYATDVCTGTTSFLLYGHGGSTGEFQQLDGMADDTMLLAFTSPFYPGYVDWYAPDGTRIATYYPGAGTPEAPDWLRAVAADPDGGSFWAGSTSGCGSSGCFDGGTVWHMDLATGDTLGTYSTGTTSIYALATVPAPPGPPEDPPPPGTEDNPPHQNQGAGGDPVSTYSGAFSTTHLDVQIRGRGPSIAFARSYNSNDTRTTSLGPGWTHSYDIRLTSPGDGSDDLILVGPQGRSDRYVEAGGSYSPPASIHRALVANPDGTFTATDKTQLVWEFSPSGRLTEIRDRYGNSSYLSYDEYGRLASVSDPAGRGSLSFTYSAGRLSSVSDWASPSRTVAFDYDATGRLWKVTDREDQTTTYTYDGSSQRIATITDARGNVTLTTTYDAQGRVASQQDARGLVTGETTTFSYVVNPDGTRETTITAPPTSFEPSFSPSLTDSYDSNGWLVQRVTQPSSSEALTQSFTYDADGNRTSVTDARGNTTKLCYDVDFAGNPISGSDGNLTRRIEPPPTTGADRPVTLIAYDAENNVIQTVAPAGVPSGGTVTCTTDLSAVDPAYVVDFAYDAAAAALLSATSRFTDPDLRLQTAVTKYEYGDAANPGLVTRVIPPRGNTGPSPDYTYATTFSYYGAGANAGLLQDATDPLGNTTSYAYDAVGRLTSSVDPLGNAAGGVPAEHSTTYAYDNEDRLRVRTLPPPVAGGSGLTDETRYDAVGNPIVRIDANGQVTTYAYDARNSLASVTESTQTWTDPANPPASVIDIEYAYDAGGNLTRVTRAAGDPQNERVTDYAYDGRGLPRTETQYPNWPSTSGSLVNATTFDANGNRLTTTDPLGQLTTYAFDALNRLTGIDYADPGTADVAYTHDANGNRASMIDGTGTTTYTYDESNRLVSVTSPGPTTIGYRYDLDGNRIKLIYPDATAVTYAFDKSGQLSSLTDWASRSLSYTYAPDGLVRTATNPDDSVATYTYDNARRLVDILHTNASAAILDRFTYTLDPVGNVASIANGPLAAQFARPDGLGGSNGSWTGTFADIDETPASDIDFLASPSGPTTSHYYELSLSDVEVPFARTGITVRYRYAKSGNDNGKTTNLTVELRQGSTVIASQTHTDIPGVDGSGWRDGNFTLSPAQANTITDFGDLRLRFDPSSTGGGQKRSAQVSWAEVEFPSIGDPASLISYSYDRLYRLTGAEDSSGARSYSYDPVGNRLSSGATAFTYDRADRITSAGATAITVDANGNLVANGSNTFGYDQANRLATAAVDGATETYAYDGDGTRFTRQVGSDPAMRYVSDNAAGLPVTISDGTRKYVYGLGLAYAVSGSAIDVYHADHLGSVRTVTNSAGSTIATYDTDAWGVPTGGSGSSSQPFGFAGEPRDATGLIYLRARYYDAELGRFLSRDSWGGHPAEPDSFNRYSYVTNNPVRFADPVGRCGIDVIADVAFSVFSLGTVIFGPDKERGENFGYFLLDAGGIFIPCGAGAGTISRILRAADRADGLGDIGGGIAGASRVLDDAQAWLGPGYREIAPGVFRSADNTRQFRMTTSDLGGANPHVHFESIASDGRTILENSHVYIVDP